MSLWIYLYVWCVTPAPCQRWRIKYGNYGNTVGVMPVYTSVVVLYNLRVVFVWFMIWRCRTFPARWLCCVAVMSSSWGSAGAGQASSLYGRLLRLSAVPGSEQHRLNDVLLLRPEPKDTQATCSENNAHVVFFPGDIQVSLNLELENRNLSSSCFSTAS